MALPATIYKSSGKNGREWHGRARRENHNLWLEGRFDIFKGCAQAKPNELTGEIRDLMGMRYA